MITILQKYVYTNFFLFFDNKLYRENEYWVPNTLSMMMVILNDGAILPAFYLILTDAFLSNFTLLFLY